MVKTNHDEQTKDTVDTIRCDATRYEQRGQKGQRGHRGHRGHRGAEGCLNLRIIQCCKGGGLLFFSFFAFLRDTVFHSVSVVMFTHHTQCATGSPHDPVFFPLQKKEKVMVEQFDMYVCTCNIIGGERGQRGSMGGWMELCCTRKQFSSRLCLDQAQENKQKTFVHSCTLAG